MTGRMRSSQSLNRRRPSRNSRDRALIVCEGEKTEPAYLADLIQSLGLSSADVRVCGKECGSDPKSIYLYAMDVFQQDGDYDTIFCVFDRDGHTTYDWAYKKILGTTLPGSKKVFCINSVPCFEYWLILHFSNTSAPIVSGGGKSSGEKAVSELRKYIPSYGKGAVGVYDSTKERMPEAIKRSKAVLVEGLKTGSENPLTFMHQLVEHLKKMAATKV